MDWAFPEKMAQRRTGRLAAPEFERGRGKLIVFPANLSYRELLPPLENNLSSGTYFLQYPAGSGSKSSAGGDYIRFMFGLFRLLPLCSCIDLHLISNRGGTPYIMTSIIAARLSGISIYLHDYRFRSETRRKLSNLIFPTCRGLEMGDASAYGDVKDFRPDIVFRNEMIDLEPYRKFVKIRAIPRVIVYGEFEEPKTVSLLMRTYELVKQKYPRTEFILTSFVTSGENLNLPVNSGRSLYSAVIENEGNLRDHFEKGDSVLLLSPGGLNRSFRMRAATAGYPVIVNGFEWAGNDENIITVTRDSYSRLADAIIRLVDDDDYYRSFASQ